MQRRVLGSVLAAATMLALLLWWGASKDGPAEPDASPAAPAPVSAEPPHRPVPPPAAPRGGPRHAVPEDGAPTGAEAPDPTACEDLDAIAPLAVDGALGPEQIACLEALLRDGTDREVELLQLLAVQAWTTDRDAWATYSLQLASIDPSPDLHHKLALHYRRDDPDAALHHVAVAREHADKWPVGRREGSLERLSVLERAICTEQPDLVDCP